MELRNEDSMKYDGGVTGETVFDVKIGLVGGYHSGRLLANRTELEAYIKEELCGSAIEQCLIICVDCGCKAIATARIGIGGLDNVSMDTATVAKIALLSNARAIFIAHNHPGNTCAPSLADIESTSRIKKALALFDIHIFDHIICCPSGETYSFASHGDLI